MRILPPIGYMTTISSMSALALTTSCAKATALNHSGYCQKGEFKVPSRAKIHKRKNQWKFGQATAAHNYRYRGDIANTFKTRLGYPDNHPGRFYARQSGLGKFGLIVQYNLSQQTIFRTKNTWLAGHLPVPGVIGQLNGSSSTKVREFTVE